MARLYKKPRKHLRRSVYWSKSYREYRDRLFTKHTGYKPIQFMGVGSPIHMWELNDAMADMLFSTASRPGFLRRLIATPEERAEQDKRSAELKAQQAVTGAKRRAVVAAYLSELLPYSRHIHYESNAV